MEGHGAERKQGQALVVAHDPLLRSRLSTLARREGLEVQVAESAVAVPAVADPALALVLLAAGSDAGVLQQSCERLRCRAPRAALLAVIDASALESSALIETGEIDEFVSAEASDPLVRHALRRHLRARSLLADLSEQRALLADSNRLAGLAAWEVDVESGELDPSPEFVALCGVESRDALRHVGALCDRVHEEDRAMVAAAVDRALSGRAPLRSQHRLVDSDGEQRFVDSRAELVERDGRSLLRGVSIDITLDEGPHEVARQLAQHDALTGLANRARLEDALRRICERSNRRGGSFAVLHLGLDGFKRLNKALGRSFGDEVLRQVADRLLASIRVGDCLVHVDEPIAPPTVGRFAGDEFTILLPELRSETDAARIARRILETISHPVAFGGHHAQITGCLGISIGPSDSGDPQRLLANALDAMYQAKDRGKQQYQFYAESSHREAYTQLVLEARLRAAVEAGDLTLYYQPKVDARSRRVTGLEALSRWVDTELGTVSPLEFIPIAESSGIIDRIGLQTVQDACRQMMTWRSAGLVPGRISINVSPKQFRQPHFGEWLLAEIDRTGLSPHFVELEITESCVMESDEAAPTLCKLRECGISIAIDDFGTGYSSLHTLRELPVDCLKIDRAFVKDLGHDEKARSLTASILSLARSLGLRVVGEGVETDEQWSFLRDHGCDEIQGFHFSRPLPPVELEELLAELEKEGRDRGPGEGRE